MPLIVCVPLPAPIVKSVGSMSHRPPPVLTMKSFSILTAAAEVSTKPPRPLGVFDCALISPRATNSPLIWPFSRVIVVMLPPANPFALIFDVSASSIFFVARRNIRPPSSTTLLALSLPLLATSAPAMPMRPASAVMSPRFVARFADPVISTVTPGVPVSTRRTRSPAAKIVSPFGVVIIPELLTVAPMR